MTPLCELAKKYGTDKCVPHNYTPLYYRLLRDRVERVKKVLEVGIGRGARSLKMWEEFFPNAQIFGVDTDRPASLNHGRVKSFRLDQTNRDEMQKLGRKFGKFDVIVEDGDHKPSSQIAAMHSLLPFLTDDGLYFLEDVWAPVQDIIKAIPSGFGVREVCRSEKPIALVHHMIVIGRDGRH